MIKKIFAEACLEPVPPSMCFERVLRVVVAGNEKLNFTHCVVNRRRLRIRWIHRTKDQCRGEFFVKYDEGQVCERSYITIKLVRSDGTAVRKYVDDKSNLPEWEEIENASYEDMDDYDMANCMP